MPFMIAALLFYAVLLLSLSIIVLTRGGIAERQSLAALLLTAAGSQIATSWAGQWRIGVEYGVMTCDIILFLLLMAVVATSNKYWPIWAAAAAFNGAITHAARWLRPSLAQEVYATIQPFWVVPVMISIAVGASMKPRR